MATVIRELRRRNVFRVAIAYLVLSWVLLQVADLLLPAFGAPEWVLRSLVVVVALGFVGALLFSWVFELTPEGLKRESQVDRSQSITDQTARKLDITVILLLLVAVPLSFVGRSDVLSNGAATMAQGERPSIAVLPFVNMSGIEENEYFSDGLTETLLHMLAQVDGLRVAARTSSFAFKGQSPDIRKVADALGVGNVLEGSVQRVGNRVRITAQLIDARDGSHLWSENYERELNDIFRIQDEIATSVAERLLQELLPESSIQAPATDSPEAYDLYLRGIDQTNAFSFESLDRGEALLVSALTLDPEFQDARLELARNLFAQFRTGKKGEQAMQRAVAELNTVLQARPDDALAEALRMASWRMRGKEVPGISSGDELRKRMQELVDRLPNEPFMQQALAMIQSDEGYRAEAVQTLENVIRLDPLNPNNHFMLADVIKGYVFSGLEVEGATVERAESALRRTIELAPDYASAWMLLSEFANYRGDGYASMQASLASLSSDPVDPEVPAATALVLYKLGDIEAGDHFMALAMERDPAAPYLRTPPLSRAINQGDMETAYAESRAVFLEGIRNRHSLHSTAIVALFVSASQLDRGDETYRFAHEVIAQVTPFFDFTTELLSLGLRLDGETDAGLADRYQEVTAAVEDNWPGREGLPDGVDVMLYAFAPAPDPVLRERALELTRPHSWLSVSYFPELSHHPLIRRLRETDPGIDAMLGDVEAAGRELRVGMHRYLREQELPSSPLPEDGS